MFGLFKSAEVRKRETELAKDIAMMEEAIAFAQREIAALERQYPEDVRRQAANYLKHMVLASERTAEGAIRLGDITAKFVEHEDRLHLATATSLAKRLVLAGAMGEEMDPASWLQFALSIASLEGAITGFLTRAGVEPWAVRYYEPVAFEQYRNKVMVAASEENA